jgi:hypothetical protein
MDFQILFSNLTNPTLLFFLLGVIAVIVKSDLEIPRSSSKFISLYLLFAIGFKGGQELAHSTYNPEILYSILFGLLLSSLIPLYTFFILKTKMDAYNAGAVAASYGSVSAVTFVSAVSFLEVQQMSSNGYMIAVMALMESPAIIVGVILIRKYTHNNQENEPNSKMRTVITHSFVNGSVLLILGSLIIGLVADTKQAEGIKPFTTDIFKGFLSIFLLEMGMVTAKRFKAFQAHGLFLSIFAILIPALNGSITALASELITNNTGNRFIFAVLAASASYIAVPAAMRIAAPKSDPGLYIPMALGLTFPFNISVGMPLYYAIVTNT